MNDLGQTVGTLAEHSSSHLAGDDSIRVSNSARAGARESLINQLELMVTTARALNLERFWMPRNRADNAYLDAGRNFADYPAPHQKELQLFRYQGKTIQKLN